MSQFVVTDGINEIGNDHKQDDKQEIIRHLHVVGVDLKGRKQRRDNESPQVFAPVGKHHAGYHRREICQSHNLPDMSCGYDYEEIAREGPYYGAQSRQRLAEIERTKKDIESQQISKDIPHVLRKEKMISLYDLAQSVGAAV